MNRNMAGKQFFLFLFMGIMGSSCVKDLRKMAEDFQNIDRIKWDPDFAAPLVRTRLSLQDLQLDTSAYIKKDADGLLYLVYENGVDAKKGSELISLDDQNASLNLSLTPQQIVDLQTQDSIMAYYQIPIAFDFGTGMELDSMELLSGNLSIALRNELPNSCRVVFQLPQVRNSSGTLNGSIEVGAGAQQSGNLNLNNTVFNLSTQFPAYNKLTADVFVYVRKGAQMPLLTDRLQVDLGFTNQAFKTVYGLIASSEIQNVYDTVAFDVLEQASIDQFTIEDPRLKFRFFNSFGIQLNADIKPVTFKYKDGRSVDITGIPSPLNITIPTLAQRGQVLADSFELNKQTSNFASQLNQKPQSLSYHAQGSISSGGNRNSFVSHDSRFRVEVAAEIPLWGSARQFVLVQESDFTANLPDEVSYVRSLNIKLFTENRFPLNVFLQAYFLDDQGNVLDSLFSEGTQLVQAAAVDAGGKVRNAAKSGLNIPFDIDKIEALKSAKRVRFKGMLDTYKTGGNYPAVKFFEDYDLAIKLAVAVGLTIEDDL